MARPVEELFPVDARTEVNVAFMRELIGEISKRIAGLELLRDGVEAVIRSGQDIALARTNELVQPALDEVDAQVAAASAAVDAANAAVSEAQTIIDNLEQDSIPVSAVDIPQESIAASAIDGLTEELAAQRRQARTFALAAGSNL